MEFWKAKPWRHFWSFFSNFYIQLDHDRCLIFVSLPTFQLRYPKIYGASNVKKWSVRTKLTWNNVIPIATLTWNIIPSESSESFQESYETGSVRGANRVIPVGCCLYSLPGVRTTSVFRPSPLTLLHWTIFRNLRRRALDHKSPIAQEHFHCLRMGG